MQTQEHPADAVLECQCGTPIVGFTSNKEYISASGGVKSVGSGYGASTESQAAADALAIERAKEHAATRLGRKLAQIASMVVSYFDKFHLIAPSGTKDIDRLWEGRLEKKPWDYKVTAAIPHLNTIEPLKACIAVLRAQTEKPYIMVIDTGSDPQVREELEGLRDIDLEIHYIHSHGWRHSSEPVCAALDLAQALCKTDYLFHTHADCFLRRMDLILSLTRMCNTENPVVGYRMSPRDWVTKDWEWMIGHTATMSRMADVFNIPITVGNGWPDTETGFNHALRAHGINPLFIGYDRNYERQIDDNIDHVRSYPGSQLYSEIVWNRTQDWMRDAILDAKSRVQAARATSSSSSPQPSEA
jgi:hypothetical protein